LSKAGDQGEGVDEKNLLNTFFSTNFEKNKHLTLPSPNHFKLSRLEQNVHSNQRKSNKKTD